MATIDYTFSITSQIIEKIYDLMVEGINETYIIDSTKHMQGTERGGHFLIQKDDTQKTITINELVNSPVPLNKADVTDINTGDFPFTFHTHPIVIKKSKKRTTVDNYPNIMSAEDLIGVVVDNYFIEREDKRQICGRTTKVKTRGIGIFDILATPCGIFLYRPNPTTIGQYNIPKKVNLKQTTDSDIAVFVKNMNNITKAAIKKHKVYYNKDYTTPDDIFNNFYINELNTKGIYATFYEWAPAKINGITFKELLPLNSRMFNNACGIISSSSPIISNTTSSTSSQHSASRKKTSKRGAVTRGAVTRSAKRK